MDRKILTYQFPKVAATKYHRLSALQQQEFILSHLWRPKSKIKVWKELAPSGDFESEKPPSASPLAFGVAAILGAPWLAVAFL